MSAVRSIPVELELRDAVLAPYKEHCRYLERATVEVSENGEEFVARISGDMGIPDSCYIDDTGHFNSVEFNICYNQLVYLLMAQCVVSGITPEFSAMTIEEYLARQLPDVLIHDFSSKFKRPLDPARFRGTVSILAANQRSKFVLVKTRCEFEDGSGGSAWGDILLAIVDRAVCSGGSPAGSEASTGA